jgi:hypothetical protein
MTVSPMDIAGATSPAARPVFEHAEADTVVATANRAMRKRDERI